MFVMLNFLFIVYYCLCVMFNYFVLINKYFFIVTEINYLVFKLLLKILCEYMHVRSWFGRSCYKKDNCAIQLYDKENNSAIQI